MKNLIYLLISIVFLCCTEDKKSVNSSSIALSAASVDDALADSLVEVFRNQILVDDMPFLENDSSAFQFYKIDLNNNQEEEIFIRFMSPYYCGTSGCTYLILSSSYEVLNRFTATKAPIIATQELVNNWRVLLTEVEGEMKMLINKNGRYPSNPAMAIDADIPISRDDLYMFDEKRAPSKTYFF